MFLWDFILSYKMSILVDIEVIRIEVVISFYFCNGFIFFWLIGYGKIFLCCY